MWGSSFNSGRPIRSSSCSYCVLPGQREVFTVTESFGPRACGVQPTGCDRCYRLFIPDALGGLTHHRFAHKIRADIINFRVLHRHLNLLALLRNGALIPGSQDTDGAVKSGTAIGQVGAAPQR